jgi:hypothetical protein
MDLPSEKRPVSHKMSEGSDVFHRFRAFFSMLGGPFRIFQPVNLFLSQFFHKEPVVGFFP